MHPHRLFIARRSYVYKLLWLMCETLSILLLWSEATIFVNLQVRRRTLCALKSVPACTAVLLVDHILRAYLAFLFPLFSLRSCLQGWTSQNLSVFGWVLKWADDL